MRLWQKSVLGFLSLLALTTLGGTAALIYFGLSGSPASAGEPLPIAAATLTPEQGTPTQTPTAALLPAGPAASPTPFQPIPLTPTFTPSPTATPTPLPTATPTATTPPMAEEAYIDGIWGFPQYYNLSCESRSAADFARYFGVYFTELEFLYALPTSDNPELGFVGDVTGPLGQLPPNGYGVHAKPVARLMRAFGLDVVADKGLSLKQLKAEIAAGRPVMVWAIKDMGYSEPVEYEASDGSTIMVARFEHTYIVIGYGDSYVTVLDNDRIYSVPTDQFLASWGVLGNMGIMTDPD